VQPLASRKKAWGALVLFAVFCIGRRPSLGQDLAPRAYLITPAGSNAITLSYTFNQGSVFVDPTVPIQDLRVQFQTQAISYYRSYSLWGRSSNITVLIPYAVANAQGTVVGALQKVYRSGLADSRIRFSLNLKGGPAMSASDFIRWSERFLIGFSFTASVPTGQYDPARLINVGTDRWAFKPEIGLSKRWGRWVLDSYTGTWFFTPNDKFFPGNALRTQQLIGTGEAHLTYYVRRRLWISLDGNFWIGGRSTVDGQMKADEQRNSRAGATISIPVNKHQAVKVSYARGAYIQIGGNYSTLSLAWQYSWLGKQE
jgi:hypothetical protein